MLKRAADKNDPKATVAAIAATKLDTVVGHIAVDGQTCRRSRRRTSPRRRWSAASGGCATASKYDIVITDNQTAPDIPVGGKMEPIG